MYTKQSDMKLFLVSMQGKELAMRRESTGCVLTAELHCFTQKETESMLANFAMEIQFCLTSLSKAEAGLDARRILCVLGLKGGCGNVDACWSAVLCNCK